jgi:hypothetical protein
MQFSFLTADCRGSRDCNAESEKGVRCQESEYRLGSHAGRKQMLKSNAVAHL